MPTTGSPRVVTPEQFIASAVPADPAPVEHVGPDAPKRDATGYEALPEYADDWKYLPGAEKYWVCCHGHFLGRDCPHPDCYPERSESLQLWVTMATNRHAPYRDLVYAEHKRYGLTPPELPPPLDRVALDAQWADDPAEQRVNTIREE